MFDWFIFGIMGLPILAGSYPLWKLGLKKDSLFFIFLTIYMIGALAVFFN